MGHRAAGRGATCETTASACMSWIAVPRRLDVRLSRSPSRIITTPPLGPMVIPRRTCRIGAWLSSRSRYLPRIVPRTTFISTIANAAPRHRRAPPPKAMNSKGENFRSRKREGRNRVVGARPPSETLGE